MEMKLTLIPAGHFKLDGGAMFGIVPKRLWAKQHPPDDNNLCTWTMRCLLVETGTRKILVDCGLGSKQDERWRSFFEPHGKDTLHGSLAKAGVAAADITDVFLTHLHFDHCGGAVDKSAEGRLLPAFPNATYWSNEQHWNWAMQPNEKEAASFLRENFVPLQEAGVLEFLPLSNGVTQWLPGISVEFVFGHTEAMMMLHLATGDDYFVFCADLLPSSFHIPMPWVMAYDIRPLTTLEEKAGLLSRAASQDWKLIFEHDPTCVCATVKKNEAGRIVVDNRFESLQNN
jgi:glyoxylase-like metal-dependent hydrolase (beta-lactamase superfamily II)